MICEWSGGVTLCSCQIFMEPKGDREWHISDHFSSHHNCEPTALKQLHMTLYCTHIWPLPTVINCPPEPKLVFNIQNSPNEVAQSPKQNVSANHINNSTKHMCMSPLSCRGMEGMLGEMAAKPDTTVRDCVLPFVSLKPLNIFGETLKHFSAVNVVKERQRLKSDIFLTSTM